MQDDRHIDALPPGHRLDCYRIEAVLGQGGFGITYRVLELSGRRRLAVKEYFPAASAMRLQSMRVGPRHAMCREEFGYGLQRFQREAEMLSRFGHANIVKVWRLLDINDTAYIVMDFEEGETLARLLGRCPEGLPERDIVRLFRGVVDGLDLVHRSGHLHRDLAPDNIILRRDLEPVIIDFGAARSAYGQRTRSMEAVIKCGYSPPEQYMVEYSRQGPWTDIYALGAIAYRCIGGPTPPGSLDRQSAVANRQPDPLVPAASLGRGRYSAALLRAIDEALLLSPQRRPASASAWYGMFAGAARERTDPGPPPAPRRRPGLLRRMFGLGEREAAEMAGARSWVLTATDSNGGVVTTRITEEALRRSHGGLVIGRDEAQSDVTIPDHTVSRRHAVLALAAEGLVIEDVNSRNGTWVDGVPLTPSRRVMVAGSSTRITLGCVNLVISEERDV